MIDEVVERPADRCCEVPAELPDPPQPVPDADPGDIPGLPV
jgi:hypothetical protein